MASFSVSSLELAPPPKGRGRPRCLEARKTVLDVTRRMLARVTYDQLSVDAIAAKSGVAKSTIYRTWRTKADIAIDAFLALVEAEVPLAPTGTLKERLTLQLHQLARIYRTDVGRFMRSVLAAAQSDPRVADTLWTRFIQRRRALTATFIADAQKAGEVRADLEVEVILDLLYAPLIYRLVMTGLPPSDETIVEQMEILFEGIRRRSGQPSA